MLTNLELFEHFKYLDWLIYKFNQNKNRNENKLNFAQGQGRILSILLIEDSLSTRDLSKRTGINISSLNEMLSKLEKKELIRRIPYEKDKRIIMNCLTEKGQDLRPKIDLSFFNCLNDSQKDIFNQCLVELSKRLENNIKGLDNEELINNCSRRRKSFEIFLEHENN